MRKERRRQYLASNPLKDFTLEITPKLSCPHRLGVGLTKHNVGDTVVILKSANSFAAIDTGD
jgi:hypothetical protein